MTDSHPNIPVVMVFSGLDPSGGAGLQADIEAIASMGCHVLPIATALTIQDTKQVVSINPTDSLLLVEQARTVLEDIHVDAFKIGLIGSVENAEVLHTLIVDYPQVPVVLDPVLSAGDGNTLADEDVITAITSLLLPQTTVLTPNSLEAQALTEGADTLDACAQELQTMGCEYVLITGTHRNTPTVENVLYGNHRKLESFTWERLPHSYHGSGCTLAASIASLLAHGLDPFAAIHEAQEYTWNALNNGYRIGMGQLVPNRMFWARGDEEEK